jgi:hypothetical protein
MLVLGHSNVVGLKKMALNGGVVTSTLEQMVCASISGLTPVVIV